MLSIIHTSFCWTSYSGRNYYPNFTMRSMLYSYQLRFVWLWNHVLNDYATQTERQMIFLDIFQAFKNLVDLWTRSQETFGLQCKSRENMRTSLLGRDQSPLGCDWGNVDSRPHCWVTLPSTPSLVSFPSSVGWRDGLAISKSPSALLQRSQKSQGVICWMPAPSGGHGP